MLGKSHIPSFVKLLAPFLLGILLYWLLPTLPLLVTPILLALFAVIYIIGHQKAWYTLESVSITFCMITIGLGNTQLNYLNNYPKALEQLNSNSQLYLRITDVPVFKSAQFVAEAALVGYHSENGIINQQSKVRLYFHGSNCRVPSIGQLITVQCDKLNPPKEPPNPYEFNYKNYLASKHQYYTAYLYPGTWYWLKQTPLRLQDKLMHFRYQMANHFKRYIKNPQAAAVVTAMVLGDRSSLDTEVTQAYAATGTIHILAVSGLHVGIIYMLLIFAVKRFAPKRWPKAASVILVLTGLALYALLTGLAPSVLRASVMFGFLCFGQMYHRRQHGVNSLAASALLLLIISPNLILQMGFWLSYMAVLGIVLLYKPIYNLLYIRNKIANFFWQMTAVSLAAQILTLPITAYFFHQMPLMGLVTNLFAVPIAFITVYTGVVMIATAKLTWLAALLGGGLSYLLMALNWAITSINQLSFASIQNIYMPWYSFVLLSATILALVVYIKGGKKLALAAMLFSIISLNTIAIVRGVNQNNQQQLVVYHLGNKTAVDIFAGKNAFSYYRPDTLNAELIERKLNPYRSYCGIQNEIPVANNYFMLNGQRIAILGKLNRINIPQKKLQLDYLILEKGYSGSLEDLLAIYKPKHIIINSSSSKKSRLQWLNTCEMLGLDCYNALNEAVIINLPAKPI